MSEDDRITLVSNYLKRNYVNEHDSRFTYFPAFATAIAGKLCVSLHATLANVEFGENSSSEGFFECLPTSREIGCFLCLGMNIMRKDMTLMSAEVIYSQKNYE